MCFSPVWAPTDVSGVLCLEFRLWGKEELSEGRGWVLSSPRPALQHHTRTFSSPGCAEHQSLPLFLVLIP